MIAGLLGVASIVGAQTIDTTLLEHAWPKQRQRQLEVGRYTVHWRDRVTRQQGVLVGLRFQTPLGQQAVWDLATDYQDIGQGTPGVTQVRIIEQGEGRQRIEIDVKVLWKQLTLIFDVERHSPDTLRFALRNPSIADYRGICRFDPIPGGGTAIELSTQLNPARPVPLGLLLLIERMTLLEGTKSFLETCEHHVKVAAR